MTRKKIHKLLIANRGEIALRIIRTCKKLGILSVAIYSDVDANMPFVKQADEAFPLHANESKDSYLHIEKIIKICKKANVDAIHPGYGFLSENSHFASELQKNGILFIGPNAESIRLMGDKVESRKKMVEAGVPVIPGYDGGNQNPEFLLERAKEIGFPVMIKASAGGGGRGIRKVESESDFFSFLESAKREALNFFSNDTVFIEKFITSPRHIEVQVFGDSFGNAIHLYERDCSVQRKNQKVVEECPSVLVSENTLHSIYKSSILAAKSIGYENAGTVEFVVSGNDYYFLEMNTRLQVEHPVTEMVTGLDLVECMIRVTEGEKLENIFPEEIPKKGHAIELRICAEEGGNNPVPQTGKIQYIHFPVEKHLRLDSGVEKGSVVSPFYDSMIAKFIVFAEDREACLDKLEGAIENSAILGVSTNLSYLLSILQNEEFREGGVNTGFIEKSLQITDTEKSTLLRATCIAHICQSLEEERESGEVWNGFRVWKSNPDFFTTQFPHLQSIYSFQKKVMLWNQKRIQEETEYRFKNQEYKAQCLQITQDEFLFKLTSENKEEGIFLEIPEIRENQILLSDKIWFYEKSGTTILLSHNAESFKFQIVDYSTHSKGTMDTIFKSPMPGKIISIKAKEGDIVEEGQPLVVIEAMKMENIVSAPAKLVVEKIYFKSGDQVYPEAELLQVSYDLG